MESRSILTETVTCAVNKLRNRNYWKGSFFEEIVKLSNDERGKWGEETFINLLNHLLLIV